MNQYELSKQLHYDCDTGIFTRLKDGKEAGYKHKLGYRVIGVFGKKYKAHRLAFIFVNGTMPEKDIDHINGVRDDNRWNNLREVDRVYNVKNAKKRKDNTSGETGVYWHKKGRKWEVKVSSNKKRVSLGLFSDFNEAVRARDEFYKKDKEYTERHGK